MPKPKTPKTDVLASSGTLSALTLVSRVLGLVREMARGALLGTKGLAEAFTAAFVVPNLMRRLFAEGSMAAAFIPVLKDYLGQGTAAAHGPADPETREFLSSVLTVLTILLCLVIGAGILSADLVAMLFFRRAEPVETALLIRIMFPFLGLASLAAFFQGILNSVHVFAPSGIAPILFNLAWIAIPGLIAPWTGNAARGMAVAVLAGGLLQALCQLPAVIKAGFRFGLARPRAAFRNAGTRRVLGLIAPTILGMAAYEINQLVSTSLGVAVGSATALNFSLRLQELILGIYVVSIGTVILPVLSAQASAGDWEGYNRRLRSSLDAVSLVTIPVSALCLIMGRDIVSLLFQMGEFGASSVELTSGIFFFHSLGLFFIGQNRIMAPAFYARKDSRSPALAGIAAVGVNIACAFALAGPLGGRGIALALVMASMANSAILVILLARKTGTDRRALTGAGLYALKITGLTLIASIPTWFMAPPLRAWASQFRTRLLSRGLPLLIVSLTFVAIGLGLLALCRDPNLGIILSRLRRGRSVPPGVLGAGDKKQS